MWDIIVKWWMDHSVRHTLYICPVYLLVRLFARGICDFVRRRHRVVRCTYKAPLSSMTGDIILLRRSKLRRRESHDRFWFRYRFASRLHTIGLNMRSKRRSIKRVPLSAIDSERMRRICESCGASKLPFCIYERVFTSIFRVEQCLIFKQCLIFRQCQL